MTSEDADWIRAKVFWRLHEGLPKQGPGSDETTIRALASAAPLPSEPRILDLGCGPGRQTVVLAAQTGGRIVALDLLEPLLEQARERVAAAGFADRVELRLASMGDLDAATYPDGSIDLIWSEGAIYNIGFRAGLEHWRRLLQPAGRVAVTEVTWLVPDPPERVRAFWAEHYPAIQDQEANRRDVAAAGYRLLDEFRVPANEWWDDYYTLIEARLETIRDERDHPAWREVVQSYDEELQVVREGLEAFGYVFYVMERDDAPG